MGRVVRGRRRDARVEGHGDFHEHEGATVLDPAGKAFVEAPGLSLAGADGDLNPRGAEGFEAVAGHRGVGIDGGGDDASEVGLDDCVSAGRRAACDAARLERDVGRAAADAVGSVLLRLFQGDNLGVIEEIVLVPALADNLTGTVEDDTADGGVGRGDADAAARKLEGALHPVEVEIGRSAHVLARGTIKCTWRGRRGWGTAPTQFASASANARF